MKKHERSFPVTFMAKQLGVSTTGYYEYRDRGLSERSQEDERLRLRIRAFHAESRKTYGAPRILGDLKDAGLAVGIHRVRRLMREDGLYGRKKRASKRTTVASGEAQGIQDLVERDFAAVAPNQLWISDLTYIRTWTGWVYLAVILDVFSRRVVGYAMAEHMRTELLLDAFADAVEQRQPEHGLIFHSDHGSQYTSADFQKALQKIGAISSMGSVGDCFDNAMAERFFGTLKEELIYRRSWPRPKDVVEHVEDYIERFYNVRRRHSSIGGISPVAFELSQLSRYKAAA